MKKPILALAALFFVASQGKSQWLNLNNPPGAIVNAVEFYNSDAMIIGTSQVIYVADQNGNGWQYDSTIGDNLEVFDILSDDPNISVFKQGGLYLSTDNRINFMPNVETMILRLYPPAAPSLQRFTKWTI